MLDGAARPRGAPRRHRPPRPARRGRRTSPATARSCSPAGSGPTTSRRRSPRCVPPASTRRAGSSVSPGEKDPELVRRLRASPREPRRRSCEVDRAMSAPARGRFDGYGGAYVPETLVPALEELEAEMDAAFADRGVHRRARSLARRVRRPADAGDPRAPPQRRPRRRADLAEARGPAPHRRAQAEQRARPGAARAAHGQAPDHRRDRRGTARGRDRDGVRGARPRVRRVHGPRGHAPPGAQRLQDGSARRRGRARSTAARRRSRTPPTRRSATGSRNVRDTHYVIGSAVGPHPYPSLVRRLQRVIGDEARAQMLSRMRAPARRWWWPASAAAATPSACSPRSSTTTCAWSASRPPGRGLDSGEHAAPLSRGRPGVLHGSLSYLMQDADGQVLATHSISAGLDYPGVGPEHSALRDSGRVEYVAADGRRGARRLPRALPARGHHPGARVRRTRCTSPRRLRARATRRRRGARLPQRPR